MDSFLQDRVQFTFFLHKMRFCADEEHLNPGVSDVSSCLNTLQYIALQ